MNNLSCKHGPGIIIMPVFLLALFFSTGGHGQSVNSADSLNHEIFQAIRSASTDKLQSLLLRGANANAVLDGYSALMAATLTGTAEQMELLLRAGAPVNYADSNGTTALWFSVPDYRKTALLLDYGADPRHSGPDNSTAVQCSFFLRYSCARLAFAERVACK